MSVRTLLGHLWRLHRLPLAVLAAGAALFEWALTRVAPDPAQASFVSELLRLLPQPVLRIFGDEIAANLSSRGFLGLGYRHPFLLLMLSVWVVRVASGALAGEIGRGTMDLIGARPVARSRQVAAALGALLAGLTVVAAAAWLGTAVGLVGRSTLGVAAGDYLPVIAGCWLLFAAFSGVGLAVSAGARDAGSAIAWTSGFIAFSFVLEYLARLWDRIGSLRPLSLFTYYQPQGILRNGLAPGDGLVLAAVGAVALAAALAVFQRRDL
ncbi:MAG: ABC transporter permease subunit [Gemmatimonadetes bacterium]|nr:ABC transporter permease subunit [Gemmatimonadota bacterium]